MKDKDFEGWTSRANRDDWSWLEDFPEDEREFAEFAVRYVIDQGPRPVPEDELNEAWKLYYTKTLIPIHTDELWKRGCLNVKLVTRDGRTDLGWKTTEHGKVMLKKR